MLWIFLLIILVGAIACVLWVRHRQEQEWMRELTYLSRHENGEKNSGAAEMKPAKEIRGADPNLQNIRQSHKAAEEARQVYEKTVAKLRELSPKHSRKLDAISGRNMPSENDNLDDLPIFAALPKTEEFAEVDDNNSVPKPVNPEQSEAAEASVHQLKAEPLEAAREDNGNDRAHDIPMFGAVLEPMVKPAEAVRSGKAMAPAPYLTFEESEYRPVKKVDADLPVITLEEATRSLHETPLADLIKSPEEETVTTVKTPPPADLEVVDINWHFKPALEMEGIQTPKPPVELKTISPDDPALVRTRSRTLAEVQKISHDVPKTEARPAAIGDASAAPEIIGEDDIRSNLLRQRLARRRQVSAESPVQEVIPNVIPEGEILANLAKTDSPVNRQRIRRVSTAMRESVIPEAARVEQSHAIRLQTPKATAPISTRFTPYTAAVIPAPTATVVEPPPVPEIEMPAIDIPPPPVFQEAEIYPHVADEVEILPEPAPVTASAHISDTPRWSITDRLISESAAVFTEHVPQRSPLAEVLGEETFEPEAEEGQCGISPAPMQQAQAQTQTANPAVHMPSENRLPSVDLLLPPQYDPSAAQTEEALLENSITIEEKLAEFKVKVKVMDAYAGPVITRYEIEPDVGVRGNAVLNLEKDLARSLSVASIRVVETIPGKSCMGLELPNPKRQMIRLSEIFNAPAFQDSKSKLTLALGQDITGEPVVTDLAKAPHLLVAGTTGSGKSVGVNAMILSMLFKATPEEVRMIMIDPKMLELSIYEGIPHLLAPVVTDMKLAANALNWCVNEMEKRYRLMSHMGVRNLAGFNQKVAEAAARGEKLANPFSLTPADPEPLEKLPFIVVVVDEFADLMMTAGKKIEELIARLAQKARAAGIHLILATQRPSVDVITGLIKANIPTRIAFQVSSKVDSRTILDQMGAENLLGQGDMLFLPPGTGYPQRVHGAFASDEEVHKVVEYLKQFGEPNYVDDILTAGVGSDDMFSNANSGRNNDGELDPMYDEAVACVLKTRKASISSVQRQLRIGYNRAARLIDQMEADGIVSAPETNGNRTVLAPPNNESLD
ncbi:DNA translocase FtsK [Neisseria sp. S1]|uniref:DNA translocase FtsK n=1 Tax=Neisseria sp. S1 TaxID=3318354 RepID=UPI003A86C1EF